MQGKNGNISKSIRRFPFKIIKKKTPPLSYSWFILSNNLILSMKIQILMEDHLIYLLRLRANTRIKDNFTCFRSVFAVCEPSTCSDLSRRD